MLERRNCLILSAAYIGVHHRQRRILDMNAQTQKIALVTGGAGSDTRECPLHQYSCQRPTRTQTCSSRSARISAYRSSKFSGYRRASPVEGAGLSRSFPSRHKTRRRSYRSPACLHETQTTLLNPTNPLLSPATTVFYFKKGSV